MRVGGYLLDDGTGLVWLDLFRRQMSGRAGSMVVSTGIYGGGAACCAKNSKFLGAYSNVKQETLLAGVHL